MFPRPRSLGYKSPPGQFPEAAAEMAEQAPPRKQQPQQTPDLPPPAGQFSPYQPAVPGFESHTEPVRCAIWESYASVLPLLLGLCLRNALLCILPGLDRRLGPLGRLLFDHLLVTSGFCLCVITTPAANYLWVLAAYAGAALLASVAAFAVVKSRWRCQGGGCASWAGERGGVMGEPAFSSGNGRARFVTEFRGLIYLPTCVCILARDLPCFHLPFGKTRTFGTGLMDIGLGCFVFMMGLTAPTARARQLTRQQRMSAMGRQGVLCLVLAACGLVRLAMAPDQAVEEYGRDWNVFFSLAAVKLLGSATELLALPALASFWRPVPPALPAAALLVAYEAALGPGGLALALVRPQDDAALATDSALASRSGADLFTANREGLASSLGLYCLYLLSLQFGRSALPLLAARSFAGLGRLAWRCLALSAVATAVHFLPRAGLALPESRRLGSLAYAAWIVAFCSAYFLACAAASCLFHLLANYPHSLQQLQQHLPGSLCREHQPQQHHFHQRQHQRQHQQVPSASSLLHVIDSRGLAYFLIGNLLTGAAGHWILPLLYGRQDFARVMPAWACAPVLMLYMLLLTLATWVLPPVPFICPSTRAETPQQQHQQPPPPPSPPQQQKLADRRQLYRGVELQTVSSV